MQVELGDRVRDTVTGLQGVALAKMESLHEALQFQVHHTEPNEDGGLHEPVWLQATRLEVIGTKDKSWQRDVL
jgi:hypothetical protein